VLRDKFSVIRILEAFIALCTTYLALFSFFSSSIYRFISDMTKWVFEGMGFVLESNRDAALYMPFVFSIVVFIVIVLEFVSGEERNTINIYQINFMLFIPEALSFSELNWFNLLDAGYLLTPYRSFSSVLVTGVIIMTGYSILSFTSRYRAQLVEYLDHGVDAGQIIVVAERQAILSFIIGLLSAFTILCASLFVNILRGITLRYVSHISYAYLVFGGLSVIGIILWLVFTLRKHERQ
jgi:hypothetical protein